MLLLAVTALDKIKTLPPAIWLKIAIAIGAFVLTIFLFRRVMKMNKIIGGLRGWHGLFFLLGLQPQRAQVHDPDRGEGRAVFPQRGLLLLQAGQPAQALTGSRGRANPRRAGIL
jgi:hypothetical protein